MSENGTLIRYLPETIARMRAQLQIDGEKWGDTWRKRDLGNQDERIGQRIFDYLDQNKNAGRPIPWVKVANLAHIAMVRQSHPDLLIDTINMTADKQKLVSFDLETARLPQESDTGDVLDYLPLGITCAALAFSDGTPIKRYSGVPQMTRLQCMYMVNDLTWLYNKGYKIVSVNGTRFDFQVLAVESKMLDECASLALNHVDLMLMVVFRKGHLLSLQRMAKGNDLHGKTKSVLLNNGTTIENMDGSLAPKYWFEGEYDAVQAYLDGDVEQTLGVAQKVDEFGVLRWLNSMGNISQIEVPGLQTVRDLYSGNIPVPNTSWMEIQHPRDEFVSWLPHNVSTYL